MTAAAQVYVKASAFFRVSTQDWPYLDACEGVRKLVDAFGADRVVWGTDMPWVSEKCGWVPPLRLLLSGLLLSGLVRHAQHHATWH